MATNDVKRGIVELLPRLRRFSYALTGNPDDGDDLVQEACARALARLDQWQPGTRLDSWVYRILHNAWIDRKRASKARGTAANIEDFPELVGDDGREISEGRLTLKRVLEAMAVMPAEHRELIALICIEGVSYQEASEILNLPIGTVTSRLVRARRALYAMAVDGPWASKGETDAVV